jgi:glucan phosphoethanolaminetransferase (alkaline phosphatase superfamily)
MIRFDLFFAKKKGHMIQRVQTIFLLLVVIAMGVTIGTQIWEQSAGTAGSWELSAFSLIQLDASGEEIQAVSKWYIAALAAFVGLLALISIFQYKTRGKQVMINMFNALFMVGLVAAVFFTANGVNEEIGSQARGSYHIGFWAILVALVCNMVANRFIRRDEALVRSVDRIR